MNAKVMSNFKPTAHTCPAGVGRGGIIAPSSGGRPNGISWIQRRGLKKARLCCHQTETEEDNYDDLIRSHSTFRNARWRRLSIIESLSWLERYYCEKTSRANKQAIFYARASYQRTKGKYDASLATLREFRDGAE